MWLSSGKQIDLGTIKWPPKIHCPEIFVVVKHQIFAARSCQRLQKPHESSIVWSQYSVPSYPDVHAAFVARGKRDKSSKIIQPIDFDGPQPIKKVRAMKFDQSSFLTDCVNRYVQLAGGNAPAHLDYTTTQEDRSTLKTMMINIHQR